MLHFYYLQSTTLATGYYQLPMNVSVLYYIQYIQLWTGMAPVWNFTFWVFARNTPRLHCPPFQNFPVFCSALDSAPAIASITLPTPLSPKCNSQHKLIRVAANFVANNCTGTMILMRSLKELRSNVGCAVEKDFTTNAGRKKHWPKVGRWRTTPNLKAATDARCAMPTPPRLKRRAKLLNRWRNGSRRKKLGLSQI